MKTILVIDDEQYVCELVREVFASNLEYRVMGANRALQGLELAHSLLPDLILLDFSMPGIGGIQMLQRLTQWPSTKRTPVLLMGGRGTDELLFRQWALGASGYLMKPFSAVELMRKVDKLIARRAAGLPAMAGRALTNTPDMRYDNLGRRELD